METNTVDTKDKFEEIWKLLSEKGLTVGEKLKVKNVFAQWAWEFNPNIERKDNIFSSRTPKIKSYGFYTEKEAEFFEALYKLAPDKSAETLIHIFAMVTKLLDIESDYKF